MFTGTHQHFLIILEEFPDTGSRICTPLVDSYVNSVGSLDHICHKCCHKWTRWSLNVSFMIWSQNPLKRHWVDSHLATGLTNFDWIIGDAYQDKVKTVLSLTGSVWVEASTLCPPSICVLFHLLSLRLVKAKQKERTQSKIECYRLKW